MANTIIGSSMVIDGEVTGDDSLEILGTVKGKISFKDAIHVNNSAIVEADLESSIITISGQVTGNVAANEKIELKAESRMIGDIRAPRILIADGAVFKGNVDMDV